MKRIIFIFALLITVNLYSIMPTVRGWMKFSNRVTRNAVASDLQSKMSLVKEIHYKYIKDFEVGIGTPTAYYTIEFYVDFNNINKSKRDAIITYIEGLRVNPDVIDFEFSWWGSHNDMRAGLCIPDNGAKVIKK